MVELLTDREQSGTVGCADAARVDQRKPLEAEGGQLQGHLPADLVQAHDERGQIPAGGLRRLAVTPAHATPPA